MLINTCCIRENADNRLYGNLGHLKAIKGRTSHMRILVAGCLAQKDRDIVREKAPWVDVVRHAQPASRSHPARPCEEWGPVTEIWEETGSIDDVPSTLPTHREVPHSAWVTITIGCDNACTFCIVPLVRGIEISRRPGDVVREVRDLAADGVVEITLLGQNVNSYGRDRSGRAPATDLCRPAASCRRGRGHQTDTVHQSTSKDIRADVLKAMAETPAVCEQLHCQCRAEAVRSSGRCSAVHPGAVFREAPA